MRPLRPDEVPRDFIGYDAATGKILWHADVRAQISNGPETYMLDGKQYVLASAGGYLYAFLFAMTLAKIEPRSYRVCVKPLRNRRHRMKPL
jgi:hypothetical protein